MLLFISNFKKNSIVMSFLVVVFLFSVYNAIIIITSPPIDITSAPNPNLENFIIAEEYIFEKKDTPVVIAGSSISKTMVNEIIIDDNNFWNLSFSGSTPQQSLYLISKSGTRPKIILIEIGWSVLNGADNKKDIDAMTDPRLCALKRLLPAFRRKYQPAAVINDFVNKHIFKFRKIDKNEIQEIIPEPSAYKVGMNNYMKLSESRPYGKIDSTLRGMSHLVHELEKRKIKILFFETPMDKKLAETDAINRIKQNALMYFPADLYAWISPPSDHGFVTTDGVHLTHASACKFFDYLKKETELRTRCGI
ncbi:MAG TPA: hypothetical protein PKN50_03630 [Spirochaetota bacterium]|nr:hypothetical protein [Spirochaetota bacterium]HPV40213.1 hypothetical protein [Spirochaetota bacterium]